MKAAKRIYAELKPSHYDLELTPDASQLVFAGSVTIHLRKTARPSQRLTFHQHGLKIQSAVIIKKDKKGDRHIPVMRINNQDTLDEVRLHTNEQIYSGEYVVTMNFSGVITKGMTGLHPCYFTLDSKRHTMLATQLESHYAREVFPCIDEPEAKATFDLTIVAPKDLTVLANTPVSREKAVTDSSLVATTFERTPKMSTYLLAFVIGELQCKSTKTNRGTDVSVWATIAQPMESFDYALDIAKRSIEFFEDYFGVPYPLPKADHVAIPDVEGSIAAMENWGLITYRESSILAYPGETSQATRENISIVITHETAHQWFGNLVTMKWWNDLWLNESFANMMEYRATDALFPEWHVWDEFIVHEGLNALRRDATAGVQAVKTIVRHPTDINTIFDPYIVYAKGGRLLYMLMNYIGEPAFRKGLSLYFKRHAFSNTDGDDLWNALSESSGIDVRTFMNQWLDRAGFPAIQVNQSANKLTLKQIHFLENGYADDGQVWPVPLFADNARLPKLLEKAEYSLRLPNDEYVLLNQHFMGHYLVAYTGQEHRRHIEQLVAKQTLDIADRVVLLNSASMLAKAGEQTFADVLELLEAYENEQADVVWSVIAVIIGEARRFIDLDDRLEAAIKRLVKKLIAKEYARLGWEEKPGETTADQKLRATIIALGSYAGDAEIIDKITIAFNKYKKKRSSMPSELRSVVFSSVVREAIPDAREFLLEEHKTTSNSDLRDEITVGLAATKDEPFAKHLLSRLTDDSEVKAQDALHWFVYLLRNRFARSATWEWLTTHWSWVEATYGNSLSYDDFPRYAAGVCNTPEWAQKYNDFFGPKEHDPGLQRNIAIGKNEIATRVAWLQRDLSAVQKFFKR